MIIEIKEKMAKDEEKRLILEYEKDAAQMVKTQYESMSDLTSYMNDPALPESMETETETNSSVIINNDSCTRHKATHKRILSK